MSFLRVNGWAIPCGQISRTPIEIGSRRRSFNGQPHVGRRAIKGSWKGRTTRQLPSIARAIEGAIFGLGESFPYDADLYSGGGLGVESSTLGTINPGVAAGDGLAIYEEATGETESKFGAGSLSVNPAATNILPADARDAENAPTGYSAVTGATLAADTIHFVQGAKGVEVTAGAAGRGVITNNSSASAAVDYVASVYIYSASAGSVRLSLMEGGGSLTDRTIILAGGKWYRAEITATAAGASTLNIQILALGSALIFTCDNFQIELGTVATAWYDGARAAELLEYPSIFAGFDLTFAAWVRSPAASPAYETTIFYARETIGPIINALQILRQSGNTNLTVKATSSAGSSSSVSVATWDGDWHHVVVTRETIGDAATRRYRVYVDGALISTSSLREINPTAWTSFFLGNNGVDGQWVGLVDDVVVTPYAITSGQITALYGLGQAMSPLPRIYIDGDFLAAPLLTQLAVGKVPGMPYMDGGVGGTFHTDLQETEFTLDAV